MATMKLTQVKAAAALAERVARKADDGDEVLTTQEVDRLEKQGQIDAATAAMLRTAIALAKNQGDQTLEGIAKALLSTRDRIVTFDKNKDRQLDDKEQKRVRTKAGAALLEFARQHGKQKIGSFKLKPDGKDLWVPRRPFRVPPNALPDQIVNALMTHFNGRANDNYAAANAPTRFVVGDAEAKGIAGAIAKMPAAQARDVLKELSARIQQPDYRGTWNPMRIFLADKAAERIEALAKKLGVRANFRGQPGAPKYDYY